MTCCTCQTVPVCKNIEAADLADLKYVAGLDANGCQKYEDAATLAPAGHPAASVTNNNAPFSWNAATQALNIPKEPTLVQLGNGSFLFTPGDGSAPTVIPADCCPTLTQQNDGSYVFHTGLGNDVIIPAIALTNNDAPFAWDSITRVGNIPKGGTLTLNADGTLTFDPGNGGANVTIPAITFTNNDAPFSWNPVTRVGNVPQVDKLTANADGSFTMNHGDGSASVSIPVIAITNNDGPFAWNPVTRVGNVPKATKLALNLDGSIGVDHGDGSADIVIPAITLTNNAAPFSWNPATRTGNIPQGAKLVANADGSYTFTPGDGSATVTIPKDCCPTLTNVGNAYQFTNGNGTVLNFTLHDPATLTNNAAPFAWNQATQTGNIPRVPSLTLQADGSYIFTPGDGGATTTIAAPAAAADLHITNMTLAGSLLTLTRSDGMSWTVTLPSTAAAGTDTKVVGVSYTPVNSTITVTNSDGSTASTTIDVCATLQELNTGIQGVPAAHKFLGDDCEWHLLPPTAINQLTPLGVGAVGVGGTTQVLGKDGLWHTLPTYIETPLTVADTATVDMTSTGTNGHDIKADVKISAADCNAIVANADGLWSQYRPPMFSASTPISSLQTLSDAVLAGYALNTDSAIGQATYDYTNNECVPMRVLVFGNSPNITFQMVADANKWLAGFGPTSAPFTWSEVLNTPVGAPSLTIGTGRGLIVLGQATVDPGDTFSIDAQVTVRIESYKANPSNAISIGATRFYVWAWPMV